MDRPFALLTTWTCYGMWKPGDERGHVSNVLRTEGGFERKKNIPGTPYAAGDDYTRTAATSKQLFPTVLLNPDQAECVVNALIDSARKREWYIVRAAVMANHVHVLTVQCPNDGSAVRRIYKGVTQAALSRLHGSPKQRWTEGGSDRYKNDDNAIQTAIHHVENQERILAGIQDMITFRNDLTSGGA
jgi:REP element-mobilizing transposase RayT